MAAPPPAGTATARKVASSTAPARPGHERSTRRAPLRVVRPARGRGARRQGQDRSRLLHGLSIALVVGSLLVVVVAQAMLANGQVRLAGIQHKLSLEASTHRQTEAAVSTLEQPYRIVSTATQVDHMVHAQVIELPYVSLTTPLPTPTVTPAPATTPTASSTSSTTAAPKR
jgi:hypothetical protein